MLRFSTGKIVATIGFIVIGLLLAVPSLFTPQQRQGFVQSIPSWVPGWMVPTRAIVLGLDLQGGSHVLLEVDVADLVRGRTGLVNQLRDDVRRVLRDNRASVEGGIQVTQRGVQLRIPDPNERARIAPKLRELSQPISNVILGQTGARNVDIAESPDGLFQLTLTEQGLNDRVRRAVDQAIEVLRRRVDALGTNEPNVQRQGADRILVQVPGLDNRTGEPVVNFKFNIRGAQRFGQTTSENVGRLLAIVLDNQVISAPRILSPITGGSGQISGRFTVQQANDLSVLLRAGALPAKLTIVEERTVGPGLGKDSIEAGKHATYVATVFVVIFMFATYGLFGFFANIALLVHVGLIFGLMSVLQATLTLPGIAGIVLTIGTAVDSNVLIYERIREELHAGRSMISAIQAGFDRAFATIVDSNSTMAIAAIILFFLGSGPVRGFAVVFILGILTTVITAVTMTRMMIAVWYHWARPKTLPF